MYQCRADAADEHCAHDHELENLLAAALLEPMAVMSSRTCSLPRFWSRWQSVVVLTVTFTFSQLDRQMLTVVAPTLGRELKLSDGQLGVLMGVMFAVFYSMFGLPIGHLVDRYSRKSLLLVSLAVWTTGTFCSGLARSFASLALWRIIVAVGEAGGNPIAYSIISDVFPENQRSTPIAVYHLGIYLAALAKSLVPPLTDAIGWHRAFQVVGAAGLVPIALVAATLVEPTRGAQDRCRDDGPRHASSPADEANRTPTAWATATTLWRTRGFPTLTIAMGVTTFVSFGVHAWLPSYLGRLAGDQPHTGSALGARLFMVELPGLAGVLLGGWLPDTLAQRSQRAQRGRWRFAGKQWIAIVPAVANTLHGFFLLGATLSGYEVASVYFACANFANGMRMAAPITLSQELADARSRGVAAAIVVVSANVIGQGGGPTLLGLLSSSLRPLCGEVDALRYAMLLVFPAASALAAALFSAVAMLMPQRDSDLTQLVASSTSSTAPDERE